MSQIFQHAWCRFLISSDFQHTSMVSLFQPLASRNMILNSLQLWLILQLKYDNIMFTIIIIILLINRLELVERFSL